jgi:hypothetical protein
MSTVIDKAKELILTIGEENAIKYFQNKIQELGDPKTFAEICKISGFEIAIEFIKKNLQSVDNFEEIKK